ncbi:phenylacetaldehyde reductase-like isoform X1 [Spinacia oleracea]|uniref:Phenylacetaldehyde reductase-like isoform X1 n=1 Tax=Spinacia oleracea TaxID=3562 RepID=A0ABM3R6Y0_SPIOL|nr:phenylacetaldehyde reductase-like isoform X1 [Spinacia oleracea]XP_056691372.1 phenylacetaldehyde reductase-like isoform X1 [Spinacia oleracea]
MAAVLLIGRPLTAESVVDETWFFVPEICEKQQMKWYLFSKTLAEEAAWDFVKEHELDMVLINPAIVIGPLLQPTINTSSFAVLSLSPLVFSKGMKKVDMLTNDLVYTPRNTSYASEELDVVREQWAASIYYWPKGA